MNGCFGIVVMNNPLYTDVELEHQFNDSGSKLLITLDLLGNRMVKLREKTKIKQIIYTSIGDYLPFPKNLLFPLVAKKKKLAADVKSAEELYKWKEVLAGASPNPPKVELSFEDVAMYQYTENPKVLEQAKDFADRMLPAFESGTGIPHYWVNLKCITSIKVKKRWSLG